MRFPEYLKKRAEFWVVFHSIRERAVESNGYKYINDNSEDLGSYVYNLTRVIGMYQIPIDYIPPHLQEIVTQSC